MHRRFAKAGRLSGTSRAHFEFEQKITKATKGKIGGMLQKTSFREDANAIVKAMKKTMGN